MFGVAALTPNVFDVAGSFYNILGTYCRLVDDSIRGAGAVYVQKAASNAFFPGTGHFPGCSGTVDADAPGVATPYEQFGSSPTVAENKSEGYFVGDTWLDASGPGAAWICASSSNATALWLQIS